MFKTVFFPFINITFIKDIFFIVVELRDFYKIVILVIRKNAVVWNAQRVNKFVSVVVLFFYELYALFNINHFEAD